MLRMTARAKRHDPEGSHYRHVEFAVAEIATPRQVGARNDIRGVGGDKPRPYALTIVT